MKYSKNTQDWHRGYQKQSNLALEGRMPWTQSSTATKYPVELPNGFNRRMLVNSNYVKESFARETAWRSKK